MIKRVFLIVLDSFGIGEMPDASFYGDEGSNTLLSCFGDKAFNAENMRSMGLFNIDGIDFGERVQVPLGAYGRLAEASKGKDTTTGHWEISGIISQRPFPTYPEGFGEEIISEFTKRTGRGVLCNKPYSGTAVIEKYGQEHMETGKLIVYTSADSVFQIAAHEDIIPIEELYEYCRVARELLQGENAVGRVIARPFTGSCPGFVRTARRHDFSLVPPKNNLLTELAHGGFDIIPIGKIYDIFAGKGLKEPIPTASNRQGMELTMKAVGEDFTGLCFTNLVDFDMLYGHRNDVEGYSRAIGEFDLWLGEFIKELKAEDMLIITADHGCDPLTESTDHSREYVPLLIYGEKIKKTNLKTRKSFADIGKTLADIFSLRGDFDGESFMKEILEI